MTKVTQQPRSVTTRRSATKRRGAKTRSRSPRHRSPLDWLTERRTRTRLRAARGQLTGSRGRGRARTVEVTTVKTVAATSVITSAFSVCRDLVRLWASSSMAHTGSPAAPEAQVSASLAVAKENSCGAHGQEPARIRISNTNNSRRQYAT